MLNALTTQTTSRERASKDMQAHKRADAGTS